MPEFRLPDLGEGLTEGEIARWLVTEGQTIDEDDLLVEISTDKTTVEIPSPYAGTVTKIYVGEGQIVPVGAVLLAIDIGLRAAPPPAALDGSEVQASRTAPAGSAVPAQNLNAERVRATPLVRRIAAELGVNVAELTGSGRNGQITEDDVRAHRAQPRSVGAEGRREKVRGVRRATIENLTRAHREVPAVTFVVECDFTGTDLQLLVPLTLRAVAESLQEFPELNARLEGDEIVYLDRYDIGVAVQTSAGLLVPVVRECHTRSIAQLDADVRRLADGARAGTLAPEELRDSTFTVTSAGKLGGLLVTPS
jgi:2-oxoisovalerate dehydrogenase E2 component (dihydrolipoyl transacylase)